MTERIPEADVTVQAYAFFCPTCGEAVDVGYNIDGMVPSWAAHEAAGTVKHCSCGREVRIPEQLYL